MRLRNPFSTNTRELFRDKYWCSKCGRSDLGLEANHTYGRESSSPFNLSVLCLRCHSHVGHTQQEHRELLLDTTRWLLSTVHYNPTADDMIFLERHDKDFIWVRENI